MRVGTSRYWLFQLIGWGVFALIYIFFAATFDRLNQSFYNRIGIFIVMGILFTHLMRWAIHRSNLLLRSLNKQIPGFILFAFITSVLIGVLETSVYEQLGLNEQKPGYTFFKNILINVFNAYMYIFIWGGIYFMYHYVTKSRKQQLDTLRLETMVKELELQTIKAHINPHFIFNSLNSIRALVDENPERARKAITELSTILRSSMQADKSESATLEKELAIVKDYLALENMRFEDRLKIEYKIDPDTLDLPVPPMMLQTLVENAIKHGISKQIQGGVVRIISVMNDNFHELTVLNTGHLNGYVNKEGFGLSSTTNRLNLLYGNKAKFEIKQSAPSLVEARVMIPLGPADY